MEKIFPCIELTFSQLKTGMRVKDSQGHFGKIKHVKDKHNIIVEYKNLGGYGFYCADKTNKKYKPLYKPLGMKPFKTFKKILGDYISPESILLLEKYWNEKTRFYHNISHLIQILQDIESNILFNELHAYEKKALLLAAFFHDAIYDPKKKDNEDQSIKFFKASYIGRDEIMPIKVIELIETTKHRKRPNNKLKKIFWDADNSGFRKGIDNQIRIEKLLRKEFKYVPEKDYRKAKIAFLKSNLGIFGLSGDNMIKKTIIYIEKTYKE